MVVRKQVFEYKFGLNGQLVFSFGRTMKIECAFNYIKCKIMLL